MEPTPVTHTCVIVWLDDSPSFHSVSSFELLAEARAYAIVDDEGIIRIINLAQVSEISFAPIEVSE